MKRSRPKRRSPVPPDVLAQIHDVNDGVCVICARPCDARRDRHHLLPVREWPEYELEPLNQVLACLNCHMNHEAAARRICLDELPPACREWLRERALMYGAIFEYVRRTYPPVGSVETTLATTQQEVQHGSRRRDPLW